MGLEHGTPKNSSIHLLLDANLKGDTFAIHWWHNILLKSQRGGMPNLKLGLLVFRYFSVRFIWLCLVKYHYQTLQVSYSFILLNVRLAYLCLDFALRSRNISLEPGFRKDFMWFIWLEESVYVTLISYSPYFLYLFLAPIMVIFMLIYVI